VGIIYPVESARDQTDLEFSPVQMHAMGDAVLRRVIAHLATIGEQPIRGDVDAAELCRALREPAPEQGTTLDPLLEALFDEWIPRSYNTASPGYLAFIPSGGIFPAALADLISNGVNRYTGVWRAAPALVQLESNALDWLRDWMQFPASTRGVFTTGGSTANLAAIVCARERRLGRASDERFRLARHTDGKTGQGCSAGDLRDSSHVHRGPSSGGIGQRQATTGAGAGKVPRRARSV
jgi:hypothetical protein